MAITLIVGQGLSNDVTLVGFFRCWFSGRLRVSGPGECVTLSYRSELAASIDLYTNQHVINWFDFSVCWGYAKFY